MWRVPVTHLELFDHGGHAHLVLVGEVVEVAEHALVHGCRRRTKGETLGFSERGEGRRRDLKPRGTRFSFLLLDQIYQAQALCWARRPYWARPFGFHL